jgi:hypothetical protein
MTRPLGVVAIAVPCAGTWEAAALVALTARLCEQPVSWDGRVVYATPIHLAVTADKDHPDYRASAQFGADADDEAVLADDEEGIEDPWAGESDTDVAEEQAPAGT